MYLLKNPWPAAGVYIVFTLTLLLLMLPKSFLLQRPIFFFQDPSLSDRIQTTIIANPNGTRAFFTRFFHNKVSFAGNNLFLSLARSTDPVFFFSLSTKPYYGDSYYFLLPGIFFPIFGIALFTLIRKWKKVKKKYRWMIPLTIFSLLVDAVFLPYTAPLTMFPLFITFQLIIFFGMYELYVSIWVKK